MTMLPITKTNQNEKYNNAMAVAG